ncbi:hypothetical protein BV497_13175 [Fulvimonas soli]|nr:hypothetical protein BV497_13175 [Fulvimonas soli]
MAGAGLALVLALGATPVMAQTANTTTKYTYDALDRLTQVTDPSGLNTTYQYDGLSNPTATSSPDTGVTARSYDAAGNVLTATDAKGIVVTYTYDAQNRRLSVSYLDSTQNIAYHYDEANSITGCSSSYPVGRLTRIVENTVTTVYCYDAQGRVIEKQQITGTGTATTGYAYTAAGRLSGIVYPSGTMVTYARDSDGRIQSLSVTPPNGTASTAVSSVTYQPFGPVSGYTLGNGQIVSRTYDANYRLTDLTSPAFSLHVARDAMGDITAIGNAPGANPATETYSYDPLYRLTAITEADGSTLESVTYNPTGDRTSKAGSGLATGAYGYNPNTHQLAATGNYARNVDPDGNTTTITAASGNLGFGYSDRNRMVLAQVAGSTVGSYTYDALGERIRKVSGMTSETYSYDEGQQLLSEQGATNRDYVWMDGIPVANVDTSGSTSTLAYVTADQLGTPRAIANASGTTDWSWPYVGNAWGEIAPTGTGYTYNLRFPGQYFDQETGLSNNVRRDYDSSTGRYLQSDPLGLLAGPSTYAYVGGNPLSNIDPMGLDDTACVMNPSLCGWGFMNTPVTSNVSVGINETGSAAILTESTEFGFAADSTPNICFYATTCASAVGLGAGGSVSGAVGVGTGALSSGDVNTAGAGFDLGDAANLGGTVQYDPSSNGFSVSKGYFGGGGGIWGGVLQCRTHYYCARNPPPPPKPPKPKC